MIQCIRKGILMKPVEGNLGTSARFNPGIATEGNTAHMLYRAVDAPLGESGYVSCIGYAQCDIEGHLLSDSNEKVIQPTLPQECFGCEDPRIVFFEGAYYIFYTAFNGVARVAIAKTKDFISYEKLGSINHSDLWDKDAFIFPERVNGKIAYMHRIIPSIQIDYFDSIEQLLDSSTWNGYADRWENSVMMKSREIWEKQKIGGCAPPILTEKGWLLFFHGVDENSVYRASAALLDRNNPSKVLARLPYPILEPREDYELNGDVNNVVFPEGIYEHNGEIYLYYGAADKYIALATVNKAELLAELEQYPEK